MAAVGCGPRLALSRRCGLQHQGVVHGRFKVAMAPAVGSTWVWHAFPRISWVQEAAVRSKRDASAYASNGKENGPLDENGVEKQGTWQDGKEGFDVESEAEKVLRIDEESQALLKDLAVAAARVSYLQSDLEKHKKREQEIANLRAEIERYAEEQAAADSAVAKYRDEVADAEQELYEASIALVSARVGDSSEDISGKWELVTVDEDAERIESGKAATVSSLVGSVASLPFLLSERTDLPNLLPSLLSERNVDLTENVDLSGVAGVAGLSGIAGVAGVFLSCALFGVCYRYIVRRDLGNFQLKAGATAAFALVRGIAQVDTTQALVGFPDQGLSEVLQACLDAGESLVTIAFAAVALDYCLREGLLEPFPSARSRRDK